jgi:hypothetical protein
MAMNLGLVGREFLQAEWLHGGELAVDLHLRLLADREVEVADFVRDEQHALDDRRQIEETHALECSIEAKGSFVEKTDGWRDLRDATSGSISHRLHHFHTRKSGAQTQVKSL